MTDQELYDGAVELLKSGTWSRLSLARKLHSSKPRLDRINDELKIPNYPKPMNASQAATWNRIVTKDKWGGKFKLRGSPSWASRVSKQS